MMEDGWPKYLDLTKFLNEMISGLTLSQINCQHNMNQPTEQQHKKEPTGKFLSSYDDFTLDESCFNDKAAFRPHMLHHTEQGIQAYAIPWIKICYVKFCISFEVGLQPPCQRQGTYRT